MTRIRTSVLIDEDLLHEAKLRELNVSKICRDGIRDILSDVPRWSNTHTRKKNDQSPGTKNVEKIRHTLSDMDMTNQSTFTEGLLRKVIRTKIGADKRTVDKYVRLLDEMGVVEPDGFGSLKLR